MLAINADAALLVLLLYAVFLVLLVVDTFQEPSQEEFDSWAAEITRYETA